MPKAFDWFAQFLRREDISHGTGYYWWHVFCQETTRTLLPGEATDTDRHAFADWVHERQARKAAKRASKAHAAAARAAALAACDRDQGAAVPTLASLLTTLIDRGVLDATKVKDVRTSLGYLAAALEAESPAVCPVDAALAVETTWGPTLDAHWRKVETPERPIGEGTRANTKTHIRRIFRLAAEQGLLAGVAPSRLAPRTTRAAFLTTFHKSGPYREHYIHADHQRYGLQQAEWPADIQAAWKTYTVKAKLFPTTRKTTIRDRTLTHTAHVLATYFGWLKNVEGLLPTWEALFEPERLQAFVTWHGTRVGKQTTAHGHHLVQKACAIAVVQAKTAAKALAAFRTQAGALGSVHTNDRQQATLVELEREALQAETTAKTLAAFREGLPAAEPMHDKDIHMVTLAELEAIGAACMAEGRVPIIRQRDDRRSPGVRRASRFQQGVILRLLVRIPLRQRNVREMRFGRGRNLFQLDGHWILRFRGEELKVGRRPKGVNEFRIDLSATYPELVTMLEEWMQTYRPRIPGAEDSPYVFLMHSGRPFTQAAFRLEIAHVVAQRSQGHVRFFPHMIRSIWPTEYLKAPKTRRDYEGAAIMLGDTVEMVIKTYNQIDIDDHQARGADFVHDQLSQTS